MLIVQENFPLFERGYHAPGIVIASAAVLNGGNEVWVDRSPQQQHPLYFDDDGVIIVQVCMAGSNNVFKFTKDSVTRLSHVGALIDLCWWDTVPLAEGEEHKPTHWPKGVKVVGTPWILKDPYAKNDVGSEADWVFEDKTHAVVEEQWQEHHATRFKAENQGDPLIQFRPHGLQVLTEEKVRKCFGLFQGELATIRFWKDLNSAITFGTLKFRRHLIEWRGDVSFSTGEANLRFNAKPVDVVVAGEFVYSAIDGGVLQQGSERLGILGDGCLSVSQYLRAMAESERNAFWSSRRHEPLPFPKPRTSKRGIFGKR